MTTTAVLKPKPKRKYKVELPISYSEEKVNAIFSAIHTYSGFTRDVARTERENRRKYLRERITELRKEDDVMPVDHSGS